MHLPHLSEDQVEELFIMENSSTEKGELMYNLYKSKAEFNKSASKIFTTKVDFMFKYMHLVSKKSYCDFSIGYTDELEKLYTEYVENTSKLRVKYLNIYNSPGYYKERLNLDFALYNKRTSLVNRHFELFVTNLQKENPENYEKIKKVK